MLQESKDLLKRNLVSLLKDLLTELSGLQPLVQLVQDQLDGIAHLLLKACSRADNLEATPVILVPQHRCPLPLIVTLHAAQFVTA